MGEAPKEHEFILILVPSLPGPAFDNIIKKIKQKHPSVEFDHHSIVFTHGPPDLSAVPSGLTPPIHRMYNTTNSYPESWKKVTILVTFNSFPPSLAAVPNLKLVHLLSAGANQMFNTPIWKESDIAITNSSGIHGPQIAEWVLMQILSHSHQQKLILQWQKEHKWGSHNELSYVKDIVGQRFGVLGYGAIGRQSMSSLKFGAALDRR